MPIPSFFALALGLSFMAGLNVYLTTFLAGLAVHFGWGDAGLHPALEIIGHPAVIIIAGLLTVVEFIMDKIPWADSLWDAVHTVIRPVGAVLLTLAVMGSGAGPVLTTVAAVLAAGVALSSHLTKSGFRLVLNASPEPFSNIVASLAEDVMVAALFFLTIYFPFTGLVVSLALLAGTWLTLPKMFRLVKANLFLVWKKVWPFGRVTGHAQVSAPLPRALTARQHRHLAEVLGIAGEAQFPATAAGGQVRAGWAVRCVTGKAGGFPGLKGNVFGTLISPEGHPGTLIFIPRRILRRAPVRLSLPGCEVRQEKLFLSENLVVYSLGDDRLATFRFSRPEAMLAGRLSADLQSRLGLMPPIPGGGGPQPAPISPSTTLSTARPGFPAMERGALPSPSPGLAGLPPSPLADLMPPASDGATG